MTIRITRREAIKAMAVGGVGLLTGRRAVGQQIVGHSTSANGKWRRGMFHMHTYWSDGHAFPEQAIDIYKNLGYEFLAVSDHNLFADDRQQWKPVEEKESGWPPVVTQPIFDAYKEALGAEVETRQEDGRTMVRLKTYDEMQRKFDEPGKFLLMPAVEITQVLNGINVHLNYLNLPDTVPSVKGGPLSKKITDPDLSVSSLIRQNAEEVAAMAARMQRSTLLMLNHPQWVYWDIQPQHLIDNPEVRFFEVCNGGSAFAPHPDALSVTLDSFWDAINAFRCLNGAPLLYGVGTDDTHYYFNRTPEQRLADAWVMVRSESLTPDALLASMDAADFYATTGVFLDDVAFDTSAKTLRVKVKAEPDVAYRIRFITTKRGFDQTVRTVDSPAEKGRGARQIPVYSGDVGKTVKLVDGTEGSYRMAPDDLYVRAKIESSVPSGYERYFHPEMQVAWTQPYA